MARPIDAGRLNKKITFLKLEYSTDKMGQSVPEWKKLKKVWATVKAVRGGEYYEAQKLRPELTYKITTRFHKGITPEMRIEYKGRIFEIKTVINVEEEDYMLEMQCVEYIEKVAESVSANE